MDLGVHDVWNDAWLNEHGEVNLQVPALDDFPFRNPMVFERREDDWLSSQVHTGEFASNCAANQTADQDEIRQSLDVMMVELEVKVLVSTNAKVCTKLE
ncbi:hypothetical protein BH23CHL5_BH23CHL5_05350 [soil metagenome]